MARRDAVRNRARVLEAARAVFRADGLDVPLERVAREAGVGSSTFYRHFPTRQDLLVGVLEDLAAGATVAEEEPGGDDQPWEQLARVFTHGCDGDEADVALFERLSRVDDGLAARARAITAAALEPVLERARRAGAVRDDVTVGAVADLMRTVNGAPAADRAVLRDVALRGLRPTADEAPAPGAGPGCGRAGS